MFRPNRNACCSWVSCVSWGVGGDEGGDGGEGGCRAIYASISSQCCCTSQCKGDSVFRGGWALSVPWGMSPGRHGMKRIEKK